MPQRFAGENNTQAQDPCKTLPHSREGEVTGHRRERVRCRQGQPPAAPADDDDATTRPSSLTTTKCSSMSMMLLLMAVAVVVVVVAVAGVVGVMASPAPPLS